ncbi:hypothetical protein KIH39_12755 [Telmatocola sphagniphila]|jgi:hypothetical protein|uniref:Uncharacterized protein n=1 Tax=Telmatocola sphagniphila TaxID=1123043 RepID=A0A8E6BA74_9BACT|nr:hypothetical protein [Telmatocola sphagniphila]QVL34737.1 hypothetical protein KIH39_12755 [Telmatocola sphagniphila]
MRRFILLGFICLAGCKGTTGPFENMKRTDKPDDPLFTMDEQQRRGRDRYALPQDTQNASSNYTNPFGPNNR